MKHTTMAIDQYDQTYHDLGGHPRKALLERLCRKSARKLYVDAKHGQPEHVGYVIADLWLRLFIVTPWKESD